MFAGILRAVSMGVMGLSLSATAAAFDLDYENARVLATYEPYNLASNVATTGGRLVMVDSQRDVLLVRDIAETEGYEVSVSQQPQYVLPLDRQRVAISDPAHDRLLVVDLGRGTVALNYKFRNSFGPWQMSYHDGIIYGANRFDRLIVRFDLDRRRELPALEGGSGPRGSAIHENLLYVVEEGQAGAPNDDHLAWYDLKRNELEGRMSLTGAVNDIAVVNGEICLAVAFPHEIRCGRPQADKWVRGDTLTYPYRFVKAAGRLWVLVRGWQGDGIPSLALLTVTGESVKTEKAWKLDKLVANARAVDFDEETRAFVVRGDRKTVAIPLLGE